MLVLPALESVGDDACRAVELAAGGKVAVQRAVREGRASAFASDTPPLQSSDAADRHLPHHSARVARSRALVACGAAGRAS